MYLLNESTNHLRRLMINRGASIASTAQNELPGGEQAYFLKDDLKRETVIFVSSIWPDPATLFDFLTYFRLLRDNKSPSPSLIIPYLAYAAPCVDATQAKTNEMMLELIRNQNPPSVAIFDYHDPDSLSRLMPMANNVSVAPLLANRLNKDDRPEAILALGRLAFSRAEELMEILGGQDEIELLDKHEKATAGAVKGRKVLLLTDAINTGQSIIEAVRMVSQKGASQIQVAATHGLFTDGAQDKLAGLPVKDIFVTNTLPQARHPAIKILDISSLLLTLN